MTLLRMAPEGAAPAEIASATEETEREASSEGNLRRFRPTGNSQLEINALSV